MDFKNLSNYTNNLSILYIEDEEIVRTQFQSILDDIFLEAHSAKDASLALEMYDSYFLQNNSYYNLLLVDIGLPKMDGIEFSRQILNINPHQQIIIMSAYNEKEKLQELLSLGITSFIPKPVNKKTFFEVIKDKAKMIIEDSIEAVNSKSLENKINDNSKKMMEKNFIHLEKEFKQYKQTSNENILFLTKKNKSIHDKNSASEEKISYLLNKIEKLKETIKSLEKAQSIL